MPEENPQLKVGVTSGLYTIGGDIQIASVIRKLGFSLTRGTDVVEISGDVPHEIDYTEGKELRHVAEKQGLELLFHGSLTVRMESADRESWREAQEHIEKSIRSAVFGGMKYVDFHACLYPWQELYTYAETKLRVAMVEFNGKFITELMKGSEEANAKLRKWFINVFWQEYAGVILDQTTLHEIEETIHKMRMTETKTAEELSKEQEKLVKQKLEEQLKAGTKRWRTEEYGNEVEAYTILAHYLFFKKDFVWRKMAELYAEEIGEVDYSKDGQNGEKTWIEEKLDEAKKEGGRLEKSFKEFFYATVSAKFLEGHLLKAFRFIKSELPEEIENNRIIEPDEDRKALINISKNLKIAIEIPDARSPSQAGLYPLWRPKQTYIAILAAREKLREEGLEQFSNNAFMLIDWEHLATHGVDPLQEFQEFTEKIPDVGKLILSVHANYPSPLHSHRPIEIGDMVIYKLLWILRKAGLGKYHKTYLIFERGGGEDPFKNSVTALRLMVEQLEKDVPPEKLPPEFFGVATGEVASPERQLTAIREHAFDPLKGLITVPEEEHGLLGRAAVEKGKAEEWRKEKYR
jgi:hypothetical protein